MSAATCLPPCHAALGTAQSRQRLVHAVLAFVAGTPLEPKSYERQLLAEFVEGQLSLEQVVQLLDAATPTQLQ